MEQLLFKGISSTFVSDWSQDDTLMMSAVAPRTHRDLWTLPVDGGGKAVPFLQTPFNEFDGRLSPDGRWLAYVSDESGRDEVYVTDLQSGRDKWRISTDSGTQIRGRLRPQIAESGPST
jgi:Tol biopolymer transport system component